MKEAQLRTHVSACRSCVDGSHGAGEIDASVNSGRVRSCVRPLFVVRRIWPLAPDAISGSDPHRDNGFISAVLVSCAGNSLTQMFDFGEDHLARCCPLKWFGFGVVGFNECVDFGDQILRARCGAG